jgi:AcrR family transcriptional regulator
MLSTVSAPEELAAPPSDSVRRLLGAAAEAFADQGYHATSTRDIASRAGLSPAGVYVHFPSKEELLFQVSRSGHEDALALVQQAIAGAPTPAAQVAAVVARFSEWHVEHYAIARVVQHEFPHLSPKHRAEVLRLRKQIDAAVREVLTAGKESGELVVDDIADTTLALLSIVVDVARWYSPHLTRTPEQIGRTNASLGLRLVGYRGNLREPATRSPAASDAGAGA